MDWYCKKYDQLTIDELYAVLQLRAEVFVVEQHCFYQDLDGKDQQSYHLLGYEGDRLQAYSRLLPSGLSYAEPAIGRVVLRATARGKGAGKILMQQSIERIYDLFGKQAIKLGAQFHLRQFYESLGFEQSSEIYDDAGIDHVEMTKSGPLKSQG